MVVHDFIFRCFILCTPITSASFHTVGQFVVAAFAIEANMIIGGRVKYSIRDCGCRLVVGVFCGFRFSIVSLTSILLLSTNWVRLEFAG